MDVDAIMPDAPMTETTTADQAPDADHAVTETVQPFEAEVGRILDLVINSLYKERDIFLRELISNASDACDKLRWESLSQPELLEGASGFAIRIVADEAQGLIEIRDDGIGMDKEDLIANLGTIARSGTARFLEAATGDRKADLNLIGQFGVGFYSVFMVADQVIVRTRKAGDQQGWMWASDGRSGYSVAEAEEKLPHGTSVTLHLKEDAREYTSEWRIREIVRRYSDHIAFPIMLEVKAKKDEADKPVGAEKSPGADEGEKPEDTGPQQINDASALWARPKSEITEEQYKEFYHHTAHAFDEPYARVHFAAEGTLSYTALLFVPSQRPFDLYDPKRHHAVKLYVRRVFIADDVETLMPRYLRFVSGVVDSEDLQLNVSRETLQHGAVVARIRKVLVKRLLDELAKKAKEKPEAASEEPTAESGESADRTPVAYETFWENFGAVLKEGLYEDRENREKLLELARFRSTHGTGWVSLADYAGRMKEGQEAIYYISGENADALRNSPQLEQAAAKGVEVLLLDDPVDEFWVTEVAEFEGRRITSLTRGDVDLSKIEGGAGDEETKDENPVELERLIARIKLVLGDAVKDVRASKRLKDSAVCLVADAGGLDMRLERFLKQHNQLDKLGGRVLELNPSHDLIRQMAGMVADEKRASGVDELARLLLDQARIIEGEPLPDPGAFSRRMSRYLARAVAG